ncbi:MAG TPA: SirB2 family protein [Burkholderiales bacterium]|nr:SirB2 family protein [Burkholderiales bacterium]
MSYLALKYVHVGCVVISYVLFFVRGVWMMHESSLLARRWVRIVPHVVDTLLLASAIALAVMIRQYPFTTPWLTAKVSGLVVYIVLGMMALKRGKTKRARVTAWIAAQAVFLYVVAVALTKDPLPFRW